MKTSKPMRKALMLALAVMLVFALAIPAFAQDYFTTTTAYYQQGTAPTYSNAIDVNFIVESRKIGSDSLYKTISVTLTPSGTQSFYVRDVLLAVQNNASNNLTFNDSSGNPIDSSDDYVYSITDTSPNPDVTYAPTSPTAWNGWMFRINGQFPLIKSNPKEGASISSAYVTNGDTIYFYHDDPSSSSASAKYAKITSITDNDSDSLTVNVKASTNYYGPAPSYTWYINNFANCQYLKVKAYNTNGTYITSGTTDSFGNVTLNVGSFGTNRYKVEVERKYFVNSDYNNGLIKNTYDVVASYNPN